MPFLVILMLVSAVMFPALSAVVAAIITLILVTRKNAAR